MLEFKIPIKGGFHDGLEVHAIELSEGKIIELANIPRDLPCFNGHFNEAEKRIYGVSRYKFSFEREQYEPLCQ